MLPHFNSFKETGFRLGGGRVRFLRNKSFLGIRNKSKEKGSKLKKKEQNSGLSVLSLALLREAAKKRFLHKWSDKAPTRRGSHYIPDFEITEYSDQYLK